MKFGKIGLTCATLFLLSAVSLTAFAQDNGQAAAPGGQGGGRRQGGGQRGGGGALVTLPISVLDSYLKLTADQKTKITAIQTQYKTDAKAFTPAPPDPAVQVDPQARRDMNQKRQEATTKADTDLKAVLTEDQTKMLVDMNRELQGYRSVGIPPEVLDELKLTSDQKTKITTISADSQKETRAKMQEAQNGGDRQALMQAVQEMNKASREKALAVLDLSQKNKLEAYVKAHPQGRGGFGGAGGGRRQGNGAPPPPPQN
jgi:hypothetical protein